MSSTGVPTPPAAAAGSTTGSTSEKKSQRILACVLCQHRKIKCDRNTPCSNCIKVCNAHFRYSRFFRSSSSFSYSYREKIPQLDTQDSYPRMAPRDRSDTYVSRPT